MKNKELTIHILLFVFTAGIGNIIYLIYKNKNKNYRYHPECKNMIDKNALIAFERDAKTRIQTKRNLVKITNHGDSCNICKKWEDQILVDDVFMSTKGNYNYNYLSDAIRSGLFHNGCSHGMTAYYPELNNKKRNIVLVDVDTGEVIEQ